MPYASDYNTEYVGEGEIEIAFFSFSIFLLNEHKRNYIFKQVKKLAFSILITFLWKKRSFLII